MEIGQAKQTSPDILPSAWLRSLFRSWFNPPQFRRWKLSGMLPLPNLAVVLPIIFLVIILTSAITPYLLTHYIPTDIDENALLEPPTLGHFFGTDQFGRDVFCLVIYGARQTTLTAGFTVILGLSAGGLIGLVSGYSIRVVDIVLMRLIDLWMSIPAMLLAIIIATALGAGYTTTIIAVGVVMVPRYARVMRSQVLSICNRPFVEASRSIGCSYLSILFKHILPHTFAPMLVMLTLGVAEVILLGAALSFIGLGVTDDRPDWGFLLSQARNYITIAWWFAAFPGLAITLLVISINTLGDALRNRFDPRLRLN